MKATLKTLVPVLFACLLSFLVGCVTTESTPAASKALAPGACPTCEGTGKCKHCHGTGTVRCTSCGGMGRKTQINSTIECSSCLGKGEKPCQVCQGDKKCRDCKGTGKAP